MITYYLSKNENKLFTAQQLTCDICSNFDYKDFDATIFEVLQLITYIKLD